MKLVEQHVIAKGDPRYVRIDEAAFASKNLWNLANYSVRQSFIFEHKYLDNTDVYHLVKSSDAYQALPAKVSNQVLIQLHKAWVSFFEAMEEWREHPEQFTGRPKLPGYKQTWLHSPPGQWSPGQSHQPTVQQTARERPEETRQSEPLYLSPA